MKLQDDTAVDDDDDEDDDDDDDRDVIGDTYRDSKSDEELTFLLDGRWTVSDLSSFVAAIDQAYSALERYFRDPNAISSQSANTSELIVRRIVYGSPGHLSVIGIGEALRQLRELIKDLLFRNSQEKLLGKMRLELIRRKLDELDVIRREAINRKHRAKVVAAVDDAVTTFNELVDEGKFVGITLRAGEQDS